MTRTKQITVTITDHYMDFIGDTYTVRRQIQARGGVWDADKQHWRVTPVTTQNVLWAGQIAHVIQDNRVTKHTTQQATQKAANAMDLHDNSNTAVLDRSDTDTIDTPVTTTRRRINRTADVQPTQQATQQTTDIATALAAFVASVGATQQPQQQAPAMDFEAVKQLISAALEPVIAELHKRPTTQVTVTSPTATRTIDGLSHYMLPDLIKCVSTGMNVWLSGPSQAGKTTAAKQVAKALGLDYYAHGSINMAHELLGFVDAGGTYRETQFVKAYRNGGLVLLDEVDRGSNEGCLSMQMALANGEMPLPDGTMLKRHPDFRCIAAANTWGGGATSDYVGAARLDAAFLQRFPVKLHWQYDAALELQMTDNVDWAMRVQQARAKAQSNGLKVLITPQATIAGARLIAAGYTPDQAAEMTYAAGLSPDQKRMIG